MDEYITKEAAIQAFEWGDADVFDDYGDYGECYNSGFSRDSIKSTINAIPTVDAVPVVRCKDCKWLYDEMDDYCCRSHRGLVRICENSFCSYGERKDGYENG